MNIPSMVSCLVILFYKIVDVFEVINNDEIELFESGNIIKKVSNECSSNVNYAEMTIQSNIRSIIKWNLNIISGASDAIIGIGHCKENKFNTKIFPDINYYFYKGKKKSGLSVMDNYGESWRPTDDASILLDLKRREIRLIINKKDYGVAFRNIATGQDIKCKLFVSLYKINDCVKIQEFIQK